jgi:hypothetical protein
MTITTISPTIGTTSVAEEPASAAGNGLDVVGRRGLGIEAGLQVQIVAT